LAGKVPSVELGVLWCKEKRGGETSCWRFSLQGKGEKGSNSRHRDNRSIHIREETEKRFAPFTVSLLVRKRRNSVGPLRHSGKEKGVISKCFPLAGGEKKAAPLPSSQEDRPEKRGVPPFGGVSLGIGPN